MDVQRLVMEWLETHWQAARRRCPVCEASSWAVGEDVAMVQGQTLSYPACPVVCTACGYMFLVNIPIVVGEAAHVALVSTVSTATQYDVGGRHGRDADRDDGEPPALAGPSHGAP